MSREKKIFEVLAVQKALRQESSELLAEALQFCIQVYAFVQCCSDKEQLPELFVHLTTSCLLGTKSADKQTIDHHLKHRAPPTDSV